ncbi:MAG: hypothetical protein LBQ66_05615, partial [Planctomycetaceae bacterium]|nr:hypothetical protein [Planctomycetaceae bacterium]
MFRILKKKVRNILPADVRREEGLRYWVASLTPSCLMPQSLPKKHTFMTAESIRHRPSLYHTSHKRIRVFVLERNNTGGVEFSVLNFTAPVQAER